MHNVNTPESADTQVVHRWKRTCQECRTVGYFRPPGAGNKTESWRNTKCRSCHSVALDYGHSVELPVKQP
jgi:hypothetical protein